MSQHDMFEDFFRLLGVTNMSDALKICAPEDFATQPSTAADMRSFESGASRINEAEDSIHQPDTTDVGPHQPSAADVEPHSANDCITNMISFESQALRISGLEGSANQPSVADAEPQPANDGNDHDNGQHQKKKHGRYTKHQTKELEASFSRCRIPGKKRKRELSQRLGLELSQIKFWFQNRRNKSKVQDKFDEIAFLKAENERLQAENAMYRETVDITCLKCGGHVALGEMTLSERLLNIEVARVKDQLSRISAVASTSSKETFVPDLSHLPSSSHPPNEFQAQPSCVREMHGEIPMTSEERGMCYPEWIDLDDELAIMVDQFNGEAPKL